MRMHIYIYKYEHVCISFTAVLISDTSDGPQHNLGSCLGLCSAYLGCLRALLVVSQLTGTVRQFPVLEGRGGLLFHPCFSRPALRHCRPQASEPDKRAHRMRSVLAAGSFTAGYIAGHEKRSYEEIKSLKSQAAKAAQNSPYSVERSPEVWATGFPGEAQAPGQSLPGDHRPRAGVPAEHCGLSSHKGSIPHVPAAGGREPERQEWQKLP